MSKGESVRLSSLELGSFNKPAINEWFTPSHGKSNWNLPDFICNYIGILIYLAC